MIERNHGVTLREFIQSRIGIQAENTPRNKYFSDHNFIGAVLYKYMHSSIEWALVTSKPDEARYTVRRKFVKQYNSYDMVENGRLKASAQQMLESAVSA